MNAKARLLGMKREQEIPPEELIFESNFVEDDEDSDDDDSDNTLPFGGKETECHRVVDDRQGVVT